MKSLHVVTSIDDEAAGPSYSVPALGRALGCAGVSTELATVDLNTKPASSGFVHRPFAMTGKPLRLARSKALLAHLQMTMPHVDISHNHSLWTMPNLYCAWASHKAGVPAVVAPRGALHPRSLQISRHVKRVFWYGAQKQACQRAAAFHATSEVEAGYIRDQGFLQPIIILPNGVDLPALPVMRQRASKPIKNLVYFGRVHPIKGIPRLLEAWKNVKAAGHGVDWRLQIVGPDNDGYAASLQADVTAKFIPDVHFKAPVYGDDKFALLATADLYILPSDSENFGMTVVEALASGTPAIATQGTPWQDLETYGCGWWPQTSVAGVQGALEQALALPIPVLRAMGAKGRALAETTYSWTAIAEQMAECYTWISSGSKGRVPTTIKVD